jgi:hypothetical protein
MTSRELDLVSFAQVGHIRYYSLARYALIEALRLSGVGFGSQVLLPSYICRDLLASLHALGASVCWYEVASDLSPAHDSDTWPIADAVLAVDYFGFPQNLNPFKDYAARTGAVLIEDNSHGYLSRDEVGQWLGCRADMGIFSLRKTLRIPDGAALWVSSEVSIDHLPPQLAFDGIGINKAQLIKTRLRRIPLVGELTYKLSTSLARLLRAWRTGSEIPETDLTAESELRGVKNPWIGLLTSLNKIDELKEIERRRSQYMHCATFGKQVGALPVFTDLPPNCAPYAYVFRGGGATQKEMRSYASKHGFDFMTWPELPGDVIKNAPDHYCNIFLVNFLW